MNENITPEFTVDERLAALEIWATGIVERLDKLAAGTFSHESGKTLVAALYDAGYKDATAKMLHRLDALDVRVEELEARAG